MMAIYLDTAWKHCADHACKYLIQLGKRNGSAGAGATPNSQMPKILSCTNTNNSCVHEKNFFQC